MCLRLHGMSLRRLFHAIVFGAELVNWVEPPSREVGSWRGRCRRFASHRDRLSASWTSLPVRGILIRALPPRRTVDFPAVSNRARNSPAILWWHGDLRDVASGSFAPPKRSKPPSIETPMSLVRILLQSSGAGGSSRQPRKGLTAEIHPPNAPLRKGSFQGLLLKCLASFAQDATSHVGQPINIEGGARAEKWSDEGPPDGVEHHGHRGRECCPILIHQPKECPVPIW